MLQALQVILSAHDLQLLIQLEHKLPLMYFPEGQPQKLLVINWKGSLQFVQ